MSDDVAARRAIIDKLAGEARVLYGREKRYDQGRTLLEQALTRCKYPEDACRSWGIYKELMHLCSVLGNYDDAVKHLGNAEKHFNQAVRNNAGKKAKDQDFKTRAWLKRRADLYVVISVLHSKRRDREQALSYLRRAENCLHAQLKRLPRGIKGAAARLAKCSACLGVTLGEYHRYDESLAALERAEQVYSELGREGKVYEMRFRRARSLFFAGRPDAARGLLGPVVDYYEASGQVDYKLLTLNAELHYAAGEIDASLDYSRRALAAFEENRDLIKHPDAQAGFTEQQFRIYDICLRIWSAAGQPPEALLKLVDKAKARRFNLMLGRRIAATPTARSHTLILKLRQLEGRLSQIDNTLYEFEGGGAERQELEAERDQLRKERGYVARKYIGETADWQADYTLKPLELKKLQAACGDALVLEFYQGAEELLLFAITADNFDLHRIPLTRSKAREEIKTMRHQLNQMRIFGGAQKAERYFRLLAKAYRDLVLAPVLPLLERRGKLVICAHGAHHLLPFALLPGADDSRFLFEERRLSYIPSLRLLLRPPRASAPPRPLILANPTGDLAQAEAEGNQLAELLEGSRLLGGADATRNAFRQNLPGSTHLHFACHAHFDSQSPEYSHLRLAGDNGGIAPLEVNEIVTLPLEHIELVVLSACESGLGKERRSDEISSLARAFLEAGAGTVVASLWKVDDPATCALMLEFYRKYRENDDPARALQQAQLALMEKYPNPNLFGSFKVIG